MVQVVMGQQNAGDIFEHKVLCLKFFAYPAPADTGIYKYGSRHLAVTHDAKDTAIATTPTRKTLEEYPFLHSRHRLLPSSQYLEMTL